MFCGKFGIYSKKARIAANLFANITNNNQITKPKTK